VLGTRIEEAVLWVDGLCDVGRGWKKDGEERKESESL
jgi:hypothetical protein